MGSFSAKKKTNRPIEVGKNRKKNKIDNRELYPLIVETPALSPEQQKKKFHLPPGFEIQLIVAEPTIGQPMNLNFDARGRLWVTHSIEYPFPAKGDLDERGKLQGVSDHEPRDAITVIENIAEDGRPEKITHFAKGLNIPIGHTPVGDGSQSILTSIPNVYVYTDNNDDGKADEKELLYGRFGNVDTHGMLSSFVSWIDGWVYGCHGFSNTSVIKDGSGNTVTMQSGNTYRFKRDGSVFEQYTWGLVNPFGMTFDPLGNQYVADCHTKPVSLMLRGAYYPSMKKPHDGLGFAPDMISHGHGSTGLGGPAYYYAQHFPKDYHDNIFICNPVNGKVHRDKLNTFGSSYMCDTQPEFITCDDQWFRPVDSIVGPDGALYIADFYNSIIGHYEVPLDHPLRDRERGRIWRIVYTGDDQSAQPLQKVVDLTLLSIDQLVARLADSNLIVRRLATNYIVEHFGNAAIPYVTEALQSSDSDFQRAHCLWVLERLDALDDALLRQFAIDESRLVRVHLMKILAERPAWKSRYFNMVRKALDDEDAFVRRAAVEALGIHCDFDNIEFLLKANEEVEAKDVQLKHAIRIAYRNQFYDEAILYALMESRILNKKQESELAEVLLSVKNEAACDFLLDYIKKNRSRSADFKEYILHIAANAKLETLEVLSAFIQNKYANNLGFQVEAMKALWQGAKQSGIAIDLEEWGTNLTRKLLAGKGVNILSAYHLMETLKLKMSRSVLMDTLKRKGAETENLPIVARALARVTESSSLEAVAVLLESEELSEGQTAKLVSGMISQDAGEMQWALKNTVRDSLKSTQRSIVLALVQDTEGIYTLMHLLRESSIPEGLIQDRSVLERLEAADIPEVNEYVAKIMATLPSQDDRIAKLISKKIKSYHKEPADPEAGAVVYQTYCSACHKMGGTGGNVGPSLDGIGIRGMGRLLEDILDPNRNIDPNFLTSIVTTSNGKTYSGILSAPKGEVRTITDSAGADVSLSIDSITSVQTSTLSPMPPVFGDIIPEEEFNHLMAYLLSQRSTAH